MGVSASTHQATPGKGERPLQPPRRQGRRTAQAAAALARPAPLQGPRSGPRGPRGGTRCPDGEFAQEPGRTFCRAGEEGRFPPAGTADLLWSCLCGGARSLRAPQHCGRRPPEEPQKPLETLAVAASCLSAMTGIMTEIHKHPQKAATRFPRAGCLFSPLGGWVRMERGQSTSLTSGVRPQPPLHLPAVVGGAHVRGSARGQQGGG